MVVKESLKCFDNATLRGVGIDKGVPFVPISPASLRITTPTLPPPAVVVGAGNPAAALRASVESAKTQSLIAVVDVDSQSPDGTLAVRVNGREQLAAAASDFRVGGRYVAEVSTSGVEGRVTLGSVAPETDLTELLAKAVLSSVEPRDSYPESLSRLSTVLESVSSTTTSEDIRRATDAAKSAIETSLKRESSSPTAESLRTFVRDGGIQYEAKLRGLTESGTPLTNEHPHIAADVKGALLGLLRMLSPDGSDPGPATVVAAARDAVAGIEARQALNALADASGGPWVVPLPVADGDEPQMAWAAIEPEDHLGSAGGPRTFRVMLKLSFTDLGETWVDAGVGPGAVRAVVYVGDEAGRTLTASRLDELRSALADDGFGQTFLEVRPASDLPATVRRRAAAAAAGVSDTHGLIDAKG